MRRQFLVSRAVFPPATLIVNILVLMVMCLFFFRVNILEAELFSKNVKRKENTGNLVFICYSHVIIIFHIRLEDNFIKQN